MSIATKLGDGGMTDFRSQRVRKDDPAIRALGDLDELQAFLSRAAQSARVQRTAAVLDFSMAVLARAMAALAAPRPADLSPEFRRELEKSLEAYEKAVDPTGFVLPGRRKSSADLDICRTVCRRAERSLVSLRDADRPELLKWANRLSDWLFLAARLEESPKAGRKLGIR